MNTLVPEDARRKMIQAGIISFNEQENLWDIAKRCAKTTGIPMGGAGLVMGAGAGTVTLPVVGTVSGAVAGFLGGLATGTASCVALNHAYREELRRIATDF